MKSQLNSPLFISSSAANQRWAGSASGYTSNSEHDWDVSTPESSDEDEIQALDIAIEAESHSLHGDAPKAQASTRPPSFLTEHQIPKSRILDFPQPSQSPGSRDQTQRSVEAVERLKANGNDVGMSDENDQGRVHGGAAHQTGEEDAGDAHETLQPYEEYGTRISTLNEFFRKFCGHMSHRDSRTAWLCPSLLPPTPQQLVATLSDFGLTEKKVRT